MIQPCYNIKITITEMQNRHLYSNDGKVQYLRYIIDVMERRLLNGSARRCYIEVYYTKVSTTATKQHDIIAIKIVPIIS